ncbi:MAG: hypothetical protein KKI09_04320 [Spirochaetes bacterium]|nr:hypothetical protein [Spirochaetota bacterium]MBU0954635.1 hypothetical protein [Spirochaetota bacterium]
MKTIALAANGEGFGHASRMVSLVQSLQYSYRLVLYAPASIQAFLLEKLDGKTPETLQIRTIPSLQFAKVGEGIKYFRTLKRNLPILLSLRSRLAILRNQLRSDSVDVLISDFEPFSTWAAKALNIPVLQINHPGVVLRSSSIQLDALLAKLVAVLMMGAYTKRQLVSFYDGDVGPIIRPQLVAKPKSCDDFILVYVKKEYRKLVLDALDAIGNISYRVYPDSGSALDYESALVSCKAVISSAGHQTISECMFLGKPLFAIPQRGQFEQRLNADRLQQSGYGRHGRLWRLERQLRTFLAEVEAGKYPYKKEVAWMLLKTDDWTERLHNRIQNFINYSPASRIIPIDAIVLDQWLANTPKSQIQACVES